MFILSQVRDGKLYGRGGADDGYAIFGSITALQALKAQGVQHGRVVIIIEAFSGLGLMLGLSWTYIIEVCEE